MATKNFHFLACFALLLASSSAVFSLEDCLYTIRVKTGTPKDAGTDAVVKMRIANSKGDYFDIPNMEKWGVMPPGHDYFENGNLDAFSVLAKCLDAPVCFMKVSHDNSGNKPGWYLSYVDLTVAGSSNTKRWTVNQWLALDESPYSLSATRDDCPYKTKSLDDLLKMSVF